MHDSGSATIPSLEPANQRWTRISLWLIVGTLAYNVAEAAVALWSGIVAGSIALIGFGLDSVIECVAAGAVLHRIRADKRGTNPEALEQVEQRVRRIVGLTFFALALYVVGQAGYVLWHRQVAEESPVGIALAVFSLLIMPLTAWGKLRAAKHLGSGALRAEAKETLACSYLSLTLLVGLVANALAGWWWSDPIAALLMVPWLVREGIEAVRGEECGE